VKIHNLGLECAAELPPQHFYCPEMCLGQEQRYLKNIVILFKVAGAMLIAASLASEIIGIGIGMFVLTVVGMAVGFGLLKVGGEHIRL
jgi:predicted nucleic acid-binding Zn ribbon protein